MMTATRIARVTAIVAVLGLSACVWDRGERRRDDDRGRDRDRATTQQHHDQDRDGRPCDQAGGGGHHEEDCRPREH